jgi:hypothetical protein
MPDYYIRKKLKLLTHPKRFLKSIFVSLRSHFYWLLFFLSGSSSKYLLCRPRGGLSDTLCQIHCCIEYAARFKRHLIIDTTKSGILDHFDNYFEPVVLFQSLSLSITSDFDLKSKRSSCVPASLFNREMSSEVEWDQNIKNFVDSLSKERLTFSFDSDYKEDLLIHEQCGGWHGNLPTLPALKYFRFKSPVREKIKNKLSGLPKKYLAVHVRHSDVLSDYKSFFNSIEGIVKGKSLLVCTDSFEVLTYARDFFKNTNIISVSDIPDTDGLPLHENALVTSWDTTVGALTDLVALAMASKIILPTEQLGYPSGFARLGSAMMQDWFIIHQLMGKTNE